jgi:hypothetical protein
MPRRTSVKSEAGDDPPLDPAPSFLRVVTVRGWRSLRTDRAFRRGEILCPLPCTARRSRPSRYTVQVAESTHVEVGVFTTLNHSCDPNLVLDTERMLVVAARDLAPGDELAYFYPSTEWDMAEPFRCGCGSAACLGIIRGARHLSLETLGRFFVNRHILRLQARNAGPARW